MSFQIYSLKGRGLFRKGARRRTTLQDYHLVDIRDEKVSPFVNFEIILPLLVFLDPLTNKHCMQGMEFYDKPVDRFQYLLSRIKNPAVSKVWPRFNNNN